MRRWAVGNRRRREMGLMAAGLVVAVGGVALMADTDDGGQDDRADDDSESHAMRLQNRQLADWAGGMCESVASLKTLREDGARQAADTYLKSAPAALENIARGLDAVDSLTRIPDTERFWAGYAKQVDRVRPEVMELTDGDDLADLSPSEKAGRAERVSALVAAIKEPSPGMHDLVWKDVGFERAFNSRRCVASRDPKPERPRPPLPPAADGASVAACADGVCEVRVTKPSVEIKVRDLTLDVTREGRKVTVRHSYPSGGEVRVNLSAEGARGTFGRSGDTVVTVELKGSNQSGAVLAITSSAPSAPSPSAASS
ncbi:hypothetical protein [Streptomyces sp. NPDC050428]|uniref:hypothetical protein n=1 Tax=Streptomyces sp. NPDC050428 TaxID=3155757 RepID=UPI003414BE22